MSLGCFTLVKNEQNWIAPHILRILPFIDEMVFFDGNSKDGTIETIEAIRDNNENGHKIRLFKNKDPKDLQDDYVRLFNECMRSLTTDLAWFLHPDMFISNPDQIILVKDSLTVALATEVRSFAGEPGGELLEIKGRCQYWKNIYRLRNPDLGAHYYGHYGARAEDVYFSAITGAQHAQYNDFSRYPYTVAKSGIEVLHFSDVRPYARRYERMLKCLDNNSWPKDEAEARARTHPRVTLIGDATFSLSPAKYPGEFLAAQSQYAKYAKEPAIV